MDGATPARPASKGPKQTVLAALVRVRFADAETLLKTGIPERRNGAMYMAGYGVECALKARICAERGEDHLDKEFYHHDFRRLAENTSKWRNLSASDEWRRTLDTLQSLWEVQMRYTMRYSDPNTVRRYLEMARSFTTWLLRN
jgi:hypothetical protein